MQNRMRRKLCKRYSRTSDGMFFTIYPIHPTLLHRIIICCFVSILIWAVNVSVRTPRSRKLSTSSSKSWTLLSALLASQNSCSVTTNASICWILTSRNMSSNVVSNKFCSVRFRLFFYFLWRTGTYFFTDACIFVAFNQFSIIDVTYSFWCTCHFPVKINSL